MKQLIQRTGTGLVTIGVVGLVILFGAFFAGIGGALISQAFSTGWRLVN